MSYVGNFAKGEVGGVTHPGKRCVSKRCLLLVNGTILGSSTAFEHKFQPVLIRVVY